jgi:hypothetical protein
MVDTYPKYRFSLDNSLNYIVHDIVRAAIRFGLVCDTARHKYIRDSCRVVARPNILAAGSIYPVSYNVRNSNIMAFRIFTSRYETYEYDGYIDWGAIAHYK